MRSLADGSTARESVSTLNNPTGTYANPAMVPAGAADNHNLRGYDTDLAIDINSYSSASGGLSLYAALPRHRYAQFGSGNPSTGTLAQPSTSTFSQTQQPHMRPWCLHRAWA